MPGVIDLPEKYYPIHAEAISEHSGEVVWEETVSEPGVLTVPDLGGEFGPVAVRVEYGEGTIIYMSSDGTVA